jgi:hypothetical protein
MTQRHWRLLLAFVSVISVGRPSNAQSLNPVADAFRRRTRDIGHRLIADVGAIPRDRAGSKPTAAQATFGEHVLSIAEQTDYMCGQVASISAPRRTDVPPGDKASLVQRVSEVFAFCDTALAAIKDSALEAPLLFDMRQTEHIGPPERVTRSAAFDAAVAYWAEADGELRQELRFVGVTPPKPCGKYILDDDDCASGVRTCRSVAFGASTVATLNDAPFAIRSDGRGPYHQGESGVVASGVSFAAVIVPHTPRDGSPARGFVVDLSHPVPNGGGAPLGIVTSTGIGEVAVQWGEGNDRITKNFLDLPVGSSDLTAQTDVEFSIDSVEHALQIGPQPIGHCFSDRPTVNGNGTSQARVTRVGAGRWVADLPNGSVARLWDVHLGYARAIDKGLYYVSLRMTFDGLPPLAAALQPAAEAGGSQATIKRYKALKSAAAKDWIFDEGQLNSVGYWLLEHHRPIDAVAVFRLNVDEYPNAWNPWDSLGEAYLVTGDTAQAIESYRRSVQLNPKSAGGIAALKRLGVRP